MKKSGANSENGCTMPWTVKILRRIHMLFCHVPQIAISMFNVLLLLLGLAVTHALVDNQHCSSAIELPCGTTVSGDTSTSSFFEEGPSCTSDYEKPTTLLNVGIILTLPPPMHRSLPPIPVPQVFQADSRSDEAPSQLVTGHWHGTSTCSRTTYDSILTLFSGPTCADLACYATQDEGCGTVGGSTFLQTKVALIPLLTRCIVKHRGLNICYEIIALNGVGLRPFPLV